MLSILITLSLISSAERSWAQCLTGNDNPSTMDPDTKTTMTSAQFAFALKSLKEVASIEPSGNIFFSPHSIQQALTLAYFGSRGTTETNLKKALNIPEQLSKVDVRAYYIAKNALQPETENNQTNYEYKSANRLWITNKKKVKDCMLNQFGNELEIVDFSIDPAGSRKMINDWVANTTNDQIKDLIPQDGITESTDLVLANAVYFKGFWQNRFDPSNTKDDIFYASGSKIVFVPYMRQKKTFNYVVSEELGAHVLELPYKGMEVSMYVLLPPFATARSANDAPSTMKNDGIRQLLDRLSTDKGLMALQELFDYGLSSMEVNVSFPRFEMERELQIDQLLETLGAGELVRPNEADLRGFLDSEKDNLHLGKAVHRAKIQINEEGTTAAAATALFSFRSSRPLEPVIFNANHPFVYLIHNKSTNSILFCGIYREPKPKEHDGPTTTSKV